MPLQHTKEPPPPLHHPVEPYQHNRLHCMESEHTKTKEARNTHHTNNDKNATTEGTLAHTQMREGTNTQPSVPRALHEADPSTETKHAACLCVVVCKEPRFAVLENRGT